MGTKPILLSAGEVFLSVKAVVDSNSGSAMSEPASFPPACHAAKLSLVWPLALNSDVSVEAFPAQYMFLVNVKLSSPAKKVVSTILPLALSGWKTMFRSNVKLEHFP